MKTDITLSAKGQTCGQLSSLGLGQAGAAAGAGAGACACTICGCRTAGLKVKPKED